MQKTILFRNILLNNIGKLIPLIIGVATIPIIITNLGLEQFGILSLVWIISGYFIFFDLGLGYATTKLVSEKLNCKNKYALQGIIQSSLLMSAALGCAGTALIVSITPFLTTHILKISPELIAGAQTSFYLIAATVPCATLIATARGALEGAQRYDIINGIKIPLNSLVMLIPAFGALYGIRLQGIVALLALLQFIGLAAYLFFCVKTFSLFKSWRKLQKIHLLRLMRFGGWTTIANVSFAFLATIDRFLISFLISVQAVGFYTAPFDMITKLLILPESLHPLFPVFSALGAQQTASAASLFARATKHLIAASGIIIVLVIVYAENILRLWLGETFATKSVPVLQLLAVAVLAVSLSLIGEYLFNGLGRPDIIAKLRIVELPLYLIGAWFAIKAFGITGAALAWTIRAFFDIVLLLLLAPSSLSIPLSALTKKIMRPVSLLLFLGIALIMIKIISRGMILYITTVIFLALYCVIWKHWIADDRDKVYMALAMEKFFKQKSTR